VDSIELSRGELSGKRSTQGDAKPNFIESSRKRTCKKRLRFRRRGGVRRRHERTRGCRPGPDISPGMEEARSGEGGSIYEIEITKGGAITSSHYLR